MQAYEINLGPHSLMRNDANSAFSEKSELPFDVNGLNGFIGNFAAAKQMIG
jgi:hypothetical protein